MKVLSYIIIVFVLFSCTSSNYLYSNYQLFEPGKIRRCKKFRPLEMVFTTDSTGYISNNYISNDTIIQYFKYKTMDENFSVMTAFSGINNQIIPVGNNDTLIHANKMLIYYLPQKDLLYFFYRKRKSEIIPLKIP